MKKVITALCNKTVNEKLKQYSEIEILTNDIQYQDGIIEVIETIQNIEYIILSELLPGENDIKGLIDKIKKIKDEIKLIVILEKENKALENYLLSKGNIYIFYNNEVEIKEIAELIINKKYKEELEEEIQELKKMILNEKESNFNNIKLLNKKEENIKYNTNHIEIITKEEKEKINKEIEEEYKENLLINKIIKKITKIFKKEKVNKENKIFIVWGNNGVGKTTFTINIAKTFKKMNKKILIIDFDDFFNNIQTILGIKNKNIFANEDYKKNNSINNYIIKINSKIDLISKFNNMLNFQENELLEIIQKIKNNYELIIIDLGTNNGENFINIIEEIDKIIFIVESNIYQLKKSKKIIEENINENKKEKIYILFNKIKKDAISFNINKEIFKNYNILGKINFIQNFNHFINNNMKEIFLKKEIKEQYKSIAKKLLKNSKLKNYYLEKIIEQ